ncbi:MAG: hypothetical protein R3293_24140 [Candidatus Promineifilaceae bacterium]|nr:hypothetical protein [Candidatus Promineifilaceae bacterium]
MYGAQLNRQPGPVNEEALQMLRDKGVRKFTEVIAADDYLLGKSLRIHHRQDEIDPDLKLYAAYLQINSPDLGTHFFVPTDFIQEFNSGKNQLVLSVPMSVVEEEQWSRFPTFVVGHVEKIEELPE